MGNRIREIGLTEATSTTREIYALYSEFDADTTARMQEVPAPEEAIRQAYEQVTDSTTRT